MTNTIDEWEEFLNPDVIRPKLISAGLFLVGHEMLLDTIKRHPLSFFADCWDVNGATPSEKYGKEILDRDPKGKRDALRGSVAWLLMMEAIDDEDVAAIRTVTDARNEIAHEMTTMVGGSKPPSFAEHFSPLMALVQKIEKWWIINVELTTNPDYDGQEIDENGIISGPSWVMQMLAQVALGEGDDAWTLHREFVQQRKHTGK